MKRCPQCGKTYDDSWEVCLSCDGKLAASAGDTAGNVPDPAICLKKYFRDRFARFDAGDGVLSWNWPAAIFQLIWYAVKGMWPKVFLYGLIMWGLQSALASFGKYAMPPFVWITAFIYFGVLANYDYYLYKRKEEFFWTRFRYRKVKVFFWFIVCASIACAGAMSLYTAGRAVVDVMGTPAAVAGPYTIDSGTFGALPAQWAVYRHPPSSFTLDASRPRDGMMPETITYPIVPGTQFAGYVVESRGQEKVMKGVVALVERRGTRSRKFDSVSGDATISMVKYLAAAQELPRFARWVGRWIAPTSPVIAYHTIDGQEWGSMDHAIQLHIGPPSTIYFSVWWTVVQGKLVFVVSEAFEPYKDEVKAQVEAFASSFRPK